LQKRKKYSVKTNTSAGKKSKDGWEAPRRRIKRRNKRPMKDHSRKFEEFAFFIHLERKISKTGGGEE